jgi:N-methylhydantoinase B
LPNVEHNEQLFPLLFLYRKELPDSGGAGKFRGGLSAESCFIPHNIDHITQDTLSSGNAIPTSTGMMGGYPSTTNAYTFVRDSDILERMGESRLIEDSSEVTGTAVLLQLRQENFVQNAADVYAVRWSGGGGFGDPLQRDPERIAHDLEHLNITPEAARDIFGAVLDADEQVDATATLENRVRIRAVRLERLGNSTVAREIHTGEVRLAAGDNLAVYGSGAARRWACAHCAADLGPLADNYKDVCLREDRPVSDSNPLVGDPGDFIDDAVAFRLFYCPACGSQIDNEIAVDSDPVMRDIELAL